MSKDLLPLANVVTIEPYDPPRRLWHIPNTPPGICPGCETKIDKSRLQFAGHDWHPECFRCSLCRQQFQNQQCVLKDDLVLHQECFQQCFCERCAKCCKLIDPKKSVQAIGRSFHSKCFTCIRCGDSDSTLEMFLTIYGFPYCKNCFNELQDNFPKCLTCKKVILPTHEHREFFFRGKKYFVHYPDCIKCTYCPSQLHSKSCCVYEFTENDDDNVQQQLVCKDCFDSANKKICASCNRPIFDAGARMENIFWHTEHFICSVCKQPLKPNTCVFYAGVLKCRTCSAQDRSKCAGCGQPVKEQGVHACGSLWHSTCLKCQFCNASVLSKKFSNIRNKPCCVDCFNKLKMENKIDKRGQLIVEDNEQILFI